MDILTSSAVSAVNWLATWRSPSREGSAGVPLAKASLQYVTRFYNYWQNSSSRNQTEESYSLDEICYLIALPVRIQIIILFGVLIELKEANKGAFGTVSYTMLHLVNN